MDFFTRNATKDERLAKEASGDIDMIISPRDGNLVVVCQQEGAHVCGYCLKPFEQSPASQKFGVEFCPPGASTDGQNFGTRMLLHAGCISLAGKRTNLISDRTRGHQVKRFITQVFKSDKK